MLYLHNMTRKIFILGGVALWLGLFVLTACRGGGERAPGSVPAELLREGDFAFPRGTGLTSRVVLAADKGGAYSHVGILSRSEGEWFVIHAVPGERDYEGDEDRVKMEPIEAFFARGRASSGAVMRVEASSDVAGRAARHALSLFRAGVLFDHEYDLTDTVKMYCTELIDYVYKSEGIDLSEGRLSRINIPVLSGDYLLPNDIAQSDKLSLIYQF